eukprot:jgi/Galph1/3869/GphlegSOOS_G2520.1
MHATKLQLLEKGLCYVPSYGFTLKAIREAVKDLGISQAAAGLVQKGPIELVEYHHCKADRETATYVHQLRLDGTEMNDILVAGLQKRFQLSEDLQSHWAQALALEHLPQNWPSASQRLFYLIGEFLHAGKDTSTDSVWYRKRLGLAGIYRLIELYWISDASPGQKLTSSFIGERIHEWSKTEKFLKELETRSWDMIDTSAGTIRSLWRSFRHGF